MRRIAFDIGEYYHVYNRGVDKRTTFENDRDYQRFLYLLYHCNNTKPLLNSQFYYRGFASIVKEDDNRERLIDIACFSIMPNHFHLLIKQRVDGGISNFMQKLGTGYTMYFNTKHKRSGVLFQGVFKAIHIDKEVYFTHLSRYIHLNPFELKEPKWKERKILNHSKLHDFIKEYPWSSYRNYLTGNKNFGGIITDRLLNDLYRPAEYEQFVKDWTLQYLNFVDGLTFET